jgi:hypothetical protein
MFSRRTDEGGYLASDGEAIEHARRPRGTPFRRRRVDPSRRGWGGTDANAAWDGRSCRLFEIVVRSRRSGDWQKRASVGRVRDADQDESRFWVFVDLGSLAPPEYYIPPEWWVQNDIHNAHQS